MAEHTARGRLHVGCSFELLTEDFSATCIRDTVRRLQAQMTQGWPCWAISDHDVERVLSRWGNRDAWAQLVNLFTAVVCSLRGSVCIYQGEEPGLIEADVSFESLREPLWHRVLAAVQGTRWLSHAVAVERRRRARRLQPWHAVAAGARGVSRARSRGSRANRVPC